MADEPIQYDIKVENAFKKYDDKNVIKGLNMSVRSGSIYGLLGSSGCGKSTLLQCILGTLTLDSGSIDLKADRLSDVGYMPQDLCLEDLLTIKEIFKYYGTLYNIPKDEIDRRIIYLSKFLQLSDISQFIRNISGGQCRRVSLAISLLHDPKIIILDEPTVGIDPLLRQEIWDEFLGMVELKKKTIIITTHYIEEAARSDCIGLMRDGILVEEGSPQYILTKYETDTLEMAFLKLCYQRNNDQLAHVNTTDVQIREDVQPQQKYLSQSEKGINVTRVKALIKKNVKVFSRDYILIAVVLLLPIFQTLVTNFGIGVNVKGMRIAIKNDEINLASCYRFKNHGCIFDQGNNQMKSCDYINSLLSRDYDLIEVEDRDTGDYLVERYQSLAFLYFPQNFTKDLVDYIGYDRTDYSSSAPVYMNYARDNYLYRNKFVKDVMDTMKQLVETILDDCSNEPKALSTPIEIIEHVGKEVNSYLDSSMAIFFSVCTFYFSSIFSVSTMLSERMDGLLGRSMFAGVKIAELLTALFCISTVVLVAQTIIPLIISYVIFSTPFLSSSSMFLYFVMIIAVGWIGFLSGIICAGVSPSRLGGLYLVNGLSMAQILLSGFSWPLEGQSEWLRSVSGLIPTAIGGKTMNDIALKGFEWNHPSIIFGSTVMVLEVVLTVLILVGLGKIKKDMWILKK